MSKQFDVVVIGGGPGGYIAAIRAAQLGFQVACVDEWKNATGGPALGGTCTNVGCIPSKALLQSSEHFDQANHHFADHGIEMKGVSMDVAKMLARKDKVVQQNNDGVLYLFKKNKVSFFHGRAAFGKAVEGGYEVAVSGTSNETLVGKNIIVATGSNARALPGTPFDEVNVLSNDGALNVGAVPKKLVLIGSGVIGLSLKKRSPSLEVVLTDVDAFALRSAQLNSMRLALPVEILHSDGLTSIDGRFDFIITNPPFHQGKNTDYQFAQNLFKQAKQHLVKDGQLWLIANRHLGYEEWAQEAFDHVEVMVQEKGFKLICAQEPR